MSQFSDLSDSQLDSAYAAYFDAGDIASASLIEQEIITRQESVFSFLESAVGVTDFPLYATRGHFKAVDAAQTAIVDHTKQVGSAIESGASSLVWGTLKVLAPVLVIGGIVFYYMYVKRRG